MNRPVLAIVDTVHTHHASAIVDKMVLAVDAGCLALLRTKSTLVALRLVDVDLEI